MSRRKPKLSIDEIKRAFQSDSGNAFPPIVSPKQLADILGYSIKTIYEWIAEGRFDGAFRKRGKHLRFWRDAALELFFNGKEWTSEQTRTDPRG